MSNVTRRSFICGTANLALLGAVSRPVFAESTPFTGALRDAIQDLLSCAKHFQELDRRAIIGTFSLRAWQTSYDCLVSTADAVRNEITDETTGRDVAIELARYHVPPSCERAILYRLPLSDMSPSYARLAHACFSAREKLARSYASPWPDLHDSFELTGDLIDAQRAIREAIPHALDDRLAARRVMESLNNDDMVDVSIVRSTMMDEALTDFRCWARSCGAFTWQRCNEWLGQEDEEWFT